MSKHTATARDKPLVFTSPDGTQATPEVDRLVLAVIGRVADKWTLQVLEALDQGGVLRFSQVAQAVGDISQKMLTKTLRKLEEDGFVTRKVYPEVPPRVEYALTDLGASLCAALCSLWQWAETHYDKLRSFRADGLPDTPASD
ncbi:winged helix-turn-helix transcriptional regulator [Bordetella genomosp. 11]|uniref:Transcriptional regulator n=1 Tax=Bordetella genomosp. 11 TaxID=1416808 RepID=A0A261UFB8_9BORD|nr:helix-turn-helix domain-containing protein [Bordetella genomosp. 11]OZI60604.1 transcriptional regulator [Bordetella genomosp. 11]